MHVMTRLSTVNFKENYYSLFVPSLLRYVKLISRNFEYVRKNRFKILAICFRQKLNRYRVASDLFEPKKMQKVIFLDSFN